MEKKCLLGYGAFNSLYNDVCFNHLSHNMWEKIDFLKKKSHFSAEVKNTTILTMCKLYNVNNNEAAYICFYHYIDEII